MAINYEKLFDDWDIPEEPSLEERIRKVYLEMKGFQDRYLHSEYDEGYDSGVGICCSLLKDSFRDIID